MKNIKFIGNALLNPLTVILNLNPGGNTRDRINTTGSGIGASLVHFITLATGGNPGIDHN